MLSISNTKHLLEDASWQVSVEIQSLIFTVGHIALHWASGNAYRGKIMQGSLFSMSFLKFTGLTFCM